MDTNIVADVRAAANRGIDALRRRQAEQARAQFANALAAAAAIENAETRREETASLGNLFMEWSFPELALLAYEDAIDLDRQLGLRAELGLHVLEAGNATSALGNEADAEQLYREALVILVAERRFAEAASASTNLGAILANRYLVADAIALLHRSLDYLAKSPYPPTERQTRFELLKLYEHTAYNVGCALDNARQLFAKFGDTLYPQQREVARTFVCRLIDRYCKAHPDTDRATWKAENFPLV